MDLHTLLGNRSEIHATLGDRRDAIKTEIEKLLTLIDPGTHDSSHWETTEKIRME